ncbi:hypothetical protein CYMTET_20491 [Cymbomonas tetramitiformis]|uniref:Polycystin cation channel PKD1/PKD2 domain-containing protein n=1 Tax=Cymbomonas tetramitiformis TaxID=36881 RepID=A0AAE0L3U6_9CHLO|nr:hypothetical protein CYMTET_20491 [Cymbomonas tetramitiformis]
MSGQSTSYVSPPASPPSPGCSLAISEDIKYYFIPTSVQPAAGNATAVVNESASTTFAPTMARRLLARGGGSTSSTKDRTAQAEGEEGEEGEDGRYEVNREYTGSLGNNETNIGLRYVARTNQVVMGVMMTAWRRKLEDCHTRFPQITMDHKGGGCATGPYNTEPYGSDAAFSMQSDLYDVSLLNEATTYFNESADATEYSVTNKTTLHPFNDPVVETSALNQKYLDGFLVFYQSAISGYRANDLTLYLEDGNYLDETTDDLLIEMLLHNSDLNTWTYLRINFAKSPGGHFETAVTETNVDEDTLTVYEDPEKMVMLVAGVLFSLLYFVADAVVYYINNDLRHFKDLEYASTVQLLLNFPCEWILPSTLPLISFGLLVRMMYLADKDLYVESYYNVYDDDYTPSNYFMVKRVDPQPGGESLERWQLEVDFAGYNRMLHQLETFERLSTIWRLFWSIQLFILVGMIIRLLCMVEFQKRMRIVTVTLRAMSSDMLHFLCIVFMLVFMYAALGTVLLGPTCDKFHTFGKSIITMGEALVGGMLSTCARENKDEGIYKLELSYAEVIAQSLFEQTYLMLVIIIVMNFLYTIVGDSLGGTEAEKNESHDSIDFLSEMAMCIVDGYEKKKSRAVRRLLERNGGQKDARLLSFLGSAELELNELQAFHSAIGLMNLHVDRRWMGRVSLDESQYVNDRMEAGNRLWRMAELAGVLAVRAADHTNKRQSFNHATMPGTAGTRGTNYYPYQMAGHVMRQLGNRRPCAHDRDGEDIAVLEKMDLEQFYRNVKVWQVRMEQEMKWLTDHQNRLIDLVARAEQVMSPRPPKSIADVYMQIRAEPRLSISPWRRLKKRIISPRK